MPVMRCSQNDLNFVNQEIEKRKTDISNSNQPEIIHDAMICYRKVERIVEVLTRKYSLENKITSIEEIISS